MGKLKRLIANKPIEGDLSQYNFKDAETNFNYENSTGLPLNRDKFVRKDLYTTCVRDGVNDAIILENIKFDGLPFIRIDKLRISNAGVSYDIRGIDIRGYMVSDQRFSPFNADGTRKSYSDLEPGNMPDGSRFFRWTPGDVSEYTDLGNASFLQQQQIVSNFSSDTGASNIIVENFANSTTTFDPVANLTLRADSPMRLIDNATSNPIYIIIWMKGDANRAWGADKRKRRVYVFQIDNLDCFDSNGDGIITPALIPEGFNKSGGGGSGGGAESAAFKINKEDFQVTICTLPGAQNQNVLNTDIIQSVIPPSDFYFSTTSGVNLIDFINISPRRQLNNDSPDGYGNETNINFPDYFVNTEIGLVNSNINSNYLGQLPPDYVDLQSYYDYADSDVISPSAPTTVTFTTNPVVSSSMDLSSPQSGSYFYYVIDWDDKDDEIKTFADYLQRSPRTVSDLLELQQQNLYKVYYRNQTERQYGPIINYPNEIITNTYNTPGIKNLKFVVFSARPKYVDDVIVSDYWEIGRWKLVKSRFYLDIPLNQYPDFGELGGSDYTTIPWPYTTPLIGGVDNSSKYKISVQSALSSGNIGDSDIIDEKFLINDLENDEMGQSILSFDLEQCRYFNKSYNMYNLLGINAIVGYRDEAPDLIPFNDDFYNASETERTFPMESSVGQIFISDIQDKNLKQSCKLELNTGELTGKSIVDSSGNSNKGLIFGDYKVKKERKGNPMRRDSFIKVPKKANNKNGAL